MIAVLDAVTEGYRSRDAGSIARQYRSDAVIFDLAPPLSHPIDAAGIRTWLDGWGAPVEQQARDLKITISGDAAFCHGLVRVSTRSTQGEDVAWWMRLTVCLERRDGGWRITHEHSSVPFHMDGSFRAAIDLAP